MKRTWSKLGFLCLIGLCISCSSEIITDDAVQPTKQAISWVPYIAREVQTRAAVMDNGQLKTTGFGIMGYVHTGSPDYATPNFMNGQVTWDDSNSQWSYSPTKYWPNNASQRLDFLAYAPYNDATHILVSGSNLTFTVDEDPTKQVDLIVATAKNQTRSNNNGAVALHFRHLLSRLQFDAKAAAGYDYEITFTSATLSNAPTEGTFNPWTGEWTITPGTGSNTVSSSTDYLLLIPGSTDGIIATIHYTLSGSERSQEITISNVLPALEAGRSYKISLIGAKDDIIFDVEAVENWNEDTTQNE